MNRSKAALRLTAGLLTALTLVTPALAASGTVQADGGLRLREGASTSSAILSVLPNGSQVEVLASADNGWYQVSYQSLTGYVSGEYLAVDGTPAATCGRVTASVLNVRSGPSTDYELVDQLAGGTKVEILETCDGWYRLDQGYVSAEYVSIIDPNAQSAGQDLVDFAMTLLGSRYVYGGSSPSGFDCSGFVKYVCNQFGYSVNRTASDQMDNGVSVSKSELQPGDLVFFNNGNSSKRATHVGIYIGSNQFIHSSTYNVGVIISDMDSAYYTTGFVGGRRVV